MWILSSSKIHECHGVLLFLADSMRFEGAQSSKVAIFGLSIGPNSALRQRKPFWGVARKKSKKSNNLARFYLCIPNTFWPQNIKEHLFSVWPENHHNGLRETYCHFFITAPKSSHAWEGSWNNELVNFIFIFFWGGGGGRRAGKEGMGATEDNSTLTEGFSSIYLTQKSW